MRQLSSAQAVNMFFIERRVMPALSQPGLRSWSLSATDNTEKTQSSKDNKRPPFNTDLSSNHLNWTFLRILNHVTKSHQEELHELL